MQRSNFNLKIAPELIGSLRMAGIVKDRANLEKKYSDPENVEVEVIEIYPENNLTRKKSKHQVRNIEEKGSVHVNVKMGPFEIDIKNINYVVFKNGKMQVNFPFRKYAHHQITVPMITFADRNIFKKIQRAIIKDLKDLSNTT